MTRQRCPWGTATPEYVAYHDTEWGVPLHDDRRLFELLCLEGAQAGLSWLAILRRRDGYRAAFDGFDPARMAACTDADRARLLSDVRIVRNRAKVDAFVGNARAFLSLTDGAAGAFDAWLWRFVGGVPIRNAWRQMADVPAQTSVSRELSTELRRAGFAFVGPTISYAFMQAAGLVNDHLVDCFRHAEVAALDR
ncbi:MAG TPA: DNA-3-methyladenine glycosylase I [Candidatus Limnocylindria bacterium]|nr:DNA-3-methyladenine glycosylase I [Candidatus Limnocylindria bacterium]